MFGTCYIVQAVNNYEYRVHKFEDGKLLPEVTYRVKLDKKKVTCSCPSGTYRGYCKHLDMAQKYRALEKAMDGYIPMLIVED